MLIAKEHRTRHRLAYALAFCAIGIAGAALTYAVLALTTRL
jgi:hypothetical protein